MLSLRQAERQSNVIYAWAAVLLAAVAKLRTAWLVPGMVLAVDKLFASEGVWNVLRPLSWCAHPAPRRGKIRTSVKLWPS